MSTNLKVAAMESRSSAWLGSARIAANGGPITDVEDVTIWARRPEDVEPARRILAQFERERTFPQWTATDAARLHASQEGND